MLVGDVDWESIIILAFMGFCIIFGLLGAVAAKKSGRLK